MEMLVLTVGILKRLYLIYICQQSVQLALLPSLFFMFHTNTSLVNFLFIILFYRQFRLCITALLATRASGQAHTPIILIILYHTLAEKARVIFRLRRSDMIATAIVILKPYGFSDILFALKARNAHTVSGRIPLGVSRISLRTQCNCVQYNSPQANKTGVILR